MIYIHKDLIYETIGGSWYYTIAHYLRKKRVPHKVVNGHGVDEVMSLNPTKDDIFIGRFAHDELDKKLSKQTLPIIWNKFDKVFPSKKSYHFYDNKKRQYKFMWSYCRSRFEHWFSKKYKKFYIWWLVKEFSIIIIFYKILSIIFLIFVKHFLILKFVVSISIVSFVFFNGEIFLL